ncbi:MAG: LEA type 2 family protein [Bacteroidota bacterium]
MIVLTALILTGYSCKIQEVNVGDLQGMKLNDISKNSISLEFMIPIENPNNFKFKITKVDLEISVNKTNLGKVKRIRKVVVPAKSNDIHDFLVEIQYDKLLSGSVSLFAGVLKNKVDIKLDGYVKVKAFMFISKKIEIHENNPVKMFNKNKK